MSEVEIDAFEVVLERNRLKAEEWKKKQLYRSSSISELQNSARKTDNDSYCYSCDIPDFNNDFKEILDMPKILGVKYSTFTDTSCETSSTDFSYIDNGDDDEENNSENEHENDS